MGVKVVCAQPSPACRETDYVRVRTCSDPFDDTVTLATIERIVEKAADAGAPGPERHIKSLIVRLPMTPDDALGFATLYAERKKIPVVYADQG